MYESTLTGMGRGRVVRTAIATCLLWITGCALIPTQTPSKPIDSPPPESTDPQIPNEPQPVADAVAAPEVVVLIGAEFGAYRELSYVFSARLERPYHLIELGVRPMAVALAELARLRPKTVIALGPSALEAATKLQDVDVVYAGVVAPEPGYRGVDALPPFALQLEYWRTMNPMLRRIGVIGGADSLAWIGEIARASAESGIELESRVVTSDRELLLAFRSMVPRLDGFVLLPDQQILSPDVIRRVIAHGDANELQMLVYSPLMYELGASLLVESEPVDVALQIIALLDSGEPTRPLTKIRTQSRKMWQRVATDG